MRNILKYLSAFIALLIFSSCVKKWLDAKPDGSLAVPSTVDDFRAMLDEPSTSLTNSGILGEFASDQDTITDAGWSSHETDVSGNAYTWSELTPYNAIGDYSVAYKVLLTLNIALEGLEKLDAENEEVKNLKGRVYFNRGRIFSELAQVFSPPYSENVIDSELGIPLRVNGNVNEATKRSTVRETYNRIISDLKMSVDLLPLTNRFIQEPTKFGAIGYLARVYMIQQKYDSALYYAQSYMSAKKSLMDFNNLSQSTVFIGPNIEMSSTSFCAGSILSRLEIPRSLYNMYDENDLRKYVFFKISPAGNITFSGSYSLRRNDTYTGIATDEMYLIASECLARKEDVTSAMKLLNDLTRTRYRTSETGSTYVDRTASTSDQALQMILIEREKELVRRGVRWSDLRRLNFDDKYKKVLKRTIGGVEYRIEPNSLKYTFPIPREVVLNASIKQNPGW